MDGRSHTYDIAISFAGEDRSRVERLAKGLRDRSIKVFYDGFEKAELWGKDLYEHLDQVYRERAKYCVVMVSKHYVEKIWTKHELQSARARALRENREYILPILLEDVNTPVVPETVSYLRWNEQDISSIVDAIELKLGKKRYLACFRFNYPYPPDPGTRNWFKIDDVTWLEQYSSGHISQHSIIDRAIVEGQSGEVVRKVSGDPAVTLVPDFDIETFIPDRAEVGDLIVHIRHRMEGEWGPWKEFCRIKYE